MIRETTIENVELDRLRPTQFTVGMLEVRHKRARLRALEKRPGELVEFILTNPVRVVAGPQRRAYVIDHHHLALALIKEHFETAPMEIEDDYSRLSRSKFWRKMRDMQFVHPVDAEGRARTVDELPATLLSLKDDPYRSLAGFVRADGGYRKVLTPFAEFAWADFFRPRIPEKMVRNHFHRALRLAMKLASGPDARTLPGYLRARRK